MITGATIFCVAATVMVYAASIPILITEWRRMQQREKKYMRFVRR